MKIDYWAQVNLGGFVYLVDSVGGVNINVTDGFCDPRYKEYGIKGFNITPGRYHMDGEEALAYARVRKAVGESDFTRAGRQQEVIGGLRDRLVRGEFLGNPSRFLKSLGQTITDQHQAVADRRLHRGRDPGQARRRVPRRVRPPAREVGLRRPGLDPDPRRQGDPQKAARLFPPTGTRPTEARFDPLPEPGNGPLRNASKSSTCGLPPKATRQARSEADAEADAEAAQADAEADQDAEADRPADARAAAVARATSRRRALTAALRQPSDVAMTGPAVIELPDPSLVVLVGRGGCRQVHLRRAPLRARRGPLVGRLPRGRSPATRPTRPRRSPRSPRSIARWRGGSRPGGSRSSTRPASSAPRAASLVAARGGRPASRRSRSCSTCPPRSSTRGTPPASGVRPDRRRGSPARRPRRLPRPGGLDAEGFAAIYRLADPAGRRSTPTLSLSRATRRRRGHDSPI